MYLLNMQISSQQQFKSFLINLSLENSNIFDTLYRKRFQRTVFHLFHFKEQSVPLETF